MNSVHYLTQQYQVVLLTVPDALARAASISFFRKAAVKVDKCANHDHSLTVCSWQKTRYNMVSMSHLSRSSASVLSSRDSNHNSTGPAVLCPFVMDCVEYFTQNTNLTGLGIRISIYAQTVILGKRRINRVLSRAHTALLRASTVTQVVLSPEKCTVALTVLGSTTLGLLVAGVVAVTQRQLSWYNAIAVENLIW